MDDEPDKPLRDPRALLASERTLLSSGAVPTSPLALLGFAESVGAALSAIVLARLLRRGPRRRREDGAVSGRVCNRALSIG